MNDEIKEILEDLKDSSEGKYINPFELTDDSCKSLLDYINNLQQENERLKEIKDSIGLQASVMKIKHLDTTIIDEELELYNEVIRLREIIENIDKYIHNWKIDEISEKTMLILNDILLIKNGMSDEVDRLEHKLPKYSMSDQVDY